MKRILSAVSLAFLLPAASAATWNFTYANLAPVPDASPLAFTSLVGQFTGQDLNGDQVLSANELSGFTLNLGAPSGFRIVPMPSLCETLTDTCATVNSFSFDLQQRTLSFDTHWQAWHESLDVMTGDALHYEGGFMAATSRWTPATTLTIAMAVPEPATVPLLLAGIVPLLLAVRRRGRGRLPGNC
jgi:hypothetical protein